MSLNKKKCEVIYTSENANVHFMDGAKITRKDEVKYLGCDINEKASTDREIRARLANTMTVLKKLDLFWLHSDCPTRTKIIALDAIIRAKLLYGLESAQLIPSVLKRLETFQLKVLRKILRLQTTYMDRANTNKKVYRLANDQMKAEGNK